MANDVDYSSRIRNDRTIPIASVRTRAVYPFSVCAASRRRCVDEVFARRLASSYPEAIDRPPALKDLCGANGGGHYQLEVPAPRPKNYRRRSTPAGRTTVPWLDGT